MGKPTGFMEIDRQDRPYGPVDGRIRDYREFVVPLPEDSVREQGARCMDCGIPFCHQGCPINNLIPDWNDLVYRGRWREASSRLHLTNNFPEFTGRVCPAPCEASCTLNLTHEPVTIKSIECAIVDRAWEEGWIVPEVAARRTGRRVAIIGSGPAGLAAAQQLARAGHDVAVYEKRARIGGLLRYGIPDFKLEKHLIDRRMAQMEGEGVIFRPNSHIGADIPVNELLRDFDALVLAGGAEHPRDLPIPGRELDGVHFAMDFLAQQNDRVAGSSPDGKELTARDKHVVVIGGGDTGSDCVGTSIRQGARSVLQIEIMPKPPEREDKLSTWPDWPLKLRTSSSQEEGCLRDWGVASRAFVGENGKLTGVELIRVDAAMKEIPGSESFARADLVLLAMGFVHPIRPGLIEELGVALDGRGNVAADASANGNADEGEYRTSVDKVFTAGDMHTGQSLVVRAIREGRACARAMDGYLR